MSETIRIILSNILVFISGAVIALITFTLTRTAKKKEKEEAAVALVFELSS
jgi:hypothetical protein